MNENEKLMGTVLPGFLCPTDPRPVSDTHVFLRDLMGTDLSKYWTGIAASSYVGNYGVNGTVPEVVTMRNLPWGPWIAGQIPFENPPSIKNQSNHIGFGPLGVNSSTRFRDVVDGMSNTVLIGERHGLDLQPSSTSWNYNFHYRAFWGMAFSIGHVLSSGYYRPNACPIGVNVPTRNDLCVHQMSSTHTGGITVVLLDGSVRFISNSIDSGQIANIDALPDFSDASARAATYSVWQSLCDMSEGNVIGEF